MPQNEDLTFTFDTSFFEDAMQTLVEKMESFKQETENIVQSVSQNFEELKEKIKTSTEKVEVFVANMDDMPGLFKKIGFNIQEAFFNVKNVFGNIKNKIKKTTDNIKMKLSKIANFFRPMFNVAKRIGGVFSKIGRFLSAPIRGVGRFIGKIKEARQTTKEMTKSFISGFQNILGKLALAGIAFKGVRAALRQMPEIGQAFGIAKDIILKNLLLPLRQAVFPLLQKFLDWVRDNRVMFVRWGQTLSNIFRTVARSVERIVETGKGLLKSFSNFTETIFGKPIKNINELLNVLSFKFAAVITFVTGMIQPLVKAFEPFVGPILKSFVTLAKNIADLVAAMLGLNQEGSNILTIFESIASTVATIVRGVLEMSNSFIEGIKPTIGAISEPLQRIADSFRRIFENIMGTEESLDFWKSAFKAIGNIVGNTLAVAFELIATSIETIEKGIKALIKFFESPAFKTFLSGVQDVVGAVGDVLGGVAGVANKAIQGVGDFFAGSEKVNDAVIKPDGTIIRTDPDDTIIATKNNVRMVTPTTGQSKTVTLGPVQIDFSGMQIVVQEATQQEAEAFAGNVVDTVRDLLNTELVRAGAR